jgi:hypothetical protein
LIEEQVRQLYNHIYSAHTHKQTLTVGNNTARHEFDLYETGKVIGGISTSPWFNQTEKHSSNTGGQDRVAAELLWLSLWGGKESRIIVLTDYEMAKRTLQRFLGCPFPYRVEILHCDLGQRSLNLLGTL